MISVSHLSANHYKIDGACVDVEYIVQGMISNNVYFISNEDTTIVVDPSSNYEAILLALDGRRVEYIFLTHCHFDHVGAAYDLREATGAQVVASAVDAEVIENPGPRTGRKTVKACPVDHSLQDGESFETGSMKWKAILTPGHTQGGMCFYLDASEGSNKQGASVLVSGDVLFHGTIGRTDFVDSSIQDMKQSLKKLAMLPNETLVLPGHESLTSIGDERIRTLERIINS